MSLTPLPSVLPLALDSNAIAAAISVDVLRDIDAIEVFDCIRSTQDYIKSQIPSNRLCVAERQIAGKGRRGRQWVAAEQGDVLLSLSWIYQSVPDALAGLSLAIVAEVAELLSVDYDVPVKIKWPNDLLLADGKLAGFIVDLETGERCRVTIGMGLNVLARKDDSSGLIDQSVSSLSQAGLHDVDRNLLIAELVDRLVKLLAAYPQDGFSVYRTKWQSYAAYIGEGVVLQRRSGIEREVVATGVLEGVDEQGCLCVRDASQTLHKIVDSELSLRLA